MLRTLFCFVCVSSVSLVSFQAVGAVEISTVAVGNPGNAADVFPSGAYGAVDHAYRIGTYEVTNAQYAEFLNAKAQSDPLSLYNPFVSGSPRAGILRSGVSGSYTYSVKPNMDNKPVNYVTWYDAIRFTNWLNNGQGNGDTETGAYTLLGNTTTPSNGLSIDRNAGAQWFLPTEAEWYKAAYYQPANQGGDIDNYWSYPTASNTLPTIATANSVGDISNPGPNVVNYFQSANWNGQIGNVTTVGSAGPLSQSFYGTWDQGGNVAEWNETLVKDQYRVLRGGSWITTDTLETGGQIGEGPTDETAWIGFRVATVPEPTSVALAVLGATALVACRRKP